MNLFPAIAEADGTSASTAGACPGRRHAAAGAVDGRHPPRGLAPPIVRRASPGTVRLVENLGAETYVLFGELGGAAVVARCRAPEPIGAGETVRLAFAAASCTSSTRDRAGAPHLAQPTARGAPSR